MKNAKIDYADPKNYILKIGDTVVLESERGLELAKVVKIENNKITLGFINDNVMSQAKSESKHSHLKMAMDSICKGWEAEFIKISPETKTLDIKPVKPQSQASHPVISKPIESPATEKPLDKKELNKEEENSNTEKNQDTRHYSPQVREMIEQFNGRIIE